MKTTRLFFFTATGGAVVGVYAVVPFAASFRPVLGGLLLPAVLAIAIVSASTTRIVTILRRTAPFAEASSDLLSMPVLVLEGQPRSGLFEGTLLTGASMAQTETVTGQRSSNLGRQPHAPRHSKTACCPDGAAGGTGEVLPDGRALDLSRLAPDRERTPVIGATRYISRS